MDTSRSPRSPSPLPALSGPAPWRPASGPRARAALAGLLLLAGTAQAADSDRTLDGRCLLEVQGRKYLDGRCPVVMGEGGGFVIGAAPGRPLTWFATVAVTTPGRAEGHWNEERGANHAHSPLGELKRQGACWVGAQARVCAWK